MRSSGFEPVPSVLSIAEFCTRACLPKRKDQALTLRSGLSRADPKLQVLNKFGRRAFIHSSWRVESLLTCQAASSQMMRIRFKVRGVSDCSSHLSRHETSARWPIIPTMRPCVEDAQPQVPCSSACANKGHKHPSLNRSLKMILPVMTDPGCQNTPASGPLPATASRLRK